MLNKISGLARSLYIVLAIVAGFVAMGGLNVALVLVVLGLIAGISMPRERMVLAAATVIALPIVGAALGNIPTDRRAARRGWRAISSWALPARWPAHSPSSFMSSRWKV